MTLEAEVANLTAQGAALLNTIDGQKDVLVQRVADATAQADRAAAQAGQVNTGVGAAAGSAAQALAIYATAAAMQAKLDTAAAQASAAQSAAASAASVQQQDLSAISAALHRSPNAITAMCIYDTSKDSDGGAWIDRMQQTSWANEPLCGTWRGALASEAAARAISGAATGDYFQLSTDGKFYKLNATTGTTEVFRGNKAKFPRLAAIVAEASSVTIYDLTGPGRPMWMRFMSGNYQTQALGWANSGSTVSSLAAANGVVFVASTAGNNVLIAFPKDDLRLVFSVGGSSGWYLKSRVMANRHATGGYILGGDGIAIINNAVNAVAMTVLPDAPFDVATGLQVPTIAVFTAGGISLIRDNGTVVNSASTASFIGGSVDKDVLTAYAAGSTFYYALKPFSLSAGFVLSTMSALAGTGVISKFSRLDRSQLARSTSGAALVSRFRLNETVPAKGSVTVISDTYSTGHMLGDIRRAYLCNTEVESVSGGELSPGGGTFDGSEGWTLNGSATIAGGSVSLEPGALIYPTSMLQVIPGKSYEVSFTISNSTANFGIRVVNRDSASGSYYPKADYFTANGTYRFVVQPTVAGSFGISRVVTHTGTLTIDNFSVKEVVADRSYKAATATIYGTLVKSQVAAAAQLVAYSGFSAANYVQEPYSADLDFGVGEWSLGAWVSYTSAVASVIAERSAATGPYLKLGTDATGKLVATAYDGTTTRTVTTPAAYNTGVFTKVRATYLPTGKLGITVNGVEVASATGAPLLTMSNANAVLTIGNSRDLDAPFPGSITLLKTGATVPTTEQAQWMYGQEKMMFRDGAQITLPAASAVTDLSYDESQDRWVALQAGYESSFTGLIRTSAAVPSAGSFSKVDAKGGVKLLSRTTTSPGVDVTIPAYGLREELVRRGEAAAKASRTLTVFDFDAGAAQVDFPLPAGWTATEVLSSGNSRREGATKDFIRLYDGFRETIRFAVAPGAATWVQINARKE